MWTIITTAAITTAVVATITWLLRSTHMRQAVETAEAQAREERETASRREAVLEIARQQAQVKLEHLGRSLAERTTERDRLAEEQKLLREQKAEAETRTARIEQELQNLAQRRDELIGEIRQQQEQLAAMQQEKAALERRQTQLQTQAEADLKAAEQKFHELKNLREGLLAQFRELSSQVLDTNGKAFLEQAKQQLEAVRKESVNDGKHTKVAIENLVKPLQEKLEAVNLHVAALEQARQKAYGELHTRLLSMAEGQKSLTTATDGLKQALRTPQGRGSWGEMNLQRTVELAGLKEHFSYERQVSIPTGQGQTRPDMVVYLPDERCIVIDAKTPMDAYLKAVETESPEDRRELLAQHARQVGQQIRILSAKAYWEQFATAPEFVVMYIPGDVFLSAALEHDPTLLDQAARQYVLLATPHTLIGMLRTIDMCWRQRAVEENAERIRRLGQELYDRLCTFGEHLGELGKKLNRTVEQYNKVVGSYESRLRVTGQRFPALGIQPGKSLPAETAISTHLRQLGADNGTGLATPSGAAE